MASECLQVDDLLATLMAMGFDFTDCQEAVTNGKLTVQSAIDWILAGKPGNAVQPALKLNTDRGSGPLQSTASNPFVPGNVQGLLGSSHDGASSCSSAAMGVDAPTDNVVSRSHLSEKQQQIKIDFEEKERQDAKRKAHEEKLKKKQDKERILKEIQEDREKLKLTKQVKMDVGQNSTQQPTVPSAGQASSTSSAPPSADKADSNTTSIQVRLPNGQMFRQSFPALATLNAVWDAVFAVIKTAMNAHTGFMQPFPRREFSQAEMSSTLQDLGLVPSGSLVLKKKDVQQATAVGPPMEVESVLAPEPSPHAHPLGFPERRMQIEEHEGNEGDDEDEEMEEGNELGIHFQGGPGFRLDERPAADGQEDMDQAEEENMNLHDRRPQLPMNPLDQFPGLGAHPILGNQRNVGVRNRMNQHVFEGFGNRLIPEGVPGDDQHRNRRAAEMAAEAAAHRYAQQGPAQQQPHPVAEGSEQSSQQQQRLHQVRPLQYLAMSLLARCLSDPRKPYVSLGGLPEEILQTFLRHLMKEGLLRPRLLPMIPSYLLKLVFDFYPYMTNEMLHAARIFPNLHTLSLKDCKLITDAGLDSIKGMSALKVINLSHCGQITDHCFTVLTALPAIQSLILEGTKVTNAGLSQFAQSGVCQNLAHLDLTGTAVTQDIFPFLHAFGKLKSLYLKQCNITGLAGVEGVTSLETLDLSETQILTDSVLCLTRLPCLRHVSLTGTQSVQGDRALSYLKDLKLSAIYLPGRSSTTDLGMAYIAGFHLSALDLTNYTNVGDSGMEYIGKIISLKKLLLTNTKVSDAGVHYLQGLTHLEVLFLDKTRVSNGSASVIACFRNLCELSLSGTSITNSFLKQAELNKCVNLTKLNLSRTIVGDKGIMFLRLPNLELLNLDCTHVHHYTLQDIETGCPSLRSIILTNLSSLPEDQGEDD